MDLHRVHSTVCARQKVGWGVVNDILLILPPPFRPQNYVALLVRLWGEISERLLSNGRWAFERFDFAISSVMDLLDGQNDYPDASAAAVNYVMKWLKKLDEHLSWRGIPMPPTGPITDDLRRLIVIKRQFLPQQVCFGVVCVRLLSTFI